VHRAIEITAPPASTDALIRELEKSDHLIGLCHNSVGARCQCCMGPALLTSRRAPMHSRRTPFTQLGAVGIFFEVRYPLAMFPGNTKICRLGDALLPLQH
jgi:hypothetical protein